MALDSNHPHYAAWLEAFDRMIDAEEAWALAAMQGAPDRSALKEGRDQARDAYLKVAEQL